MPVVVDHLDDRQVEGLGELEIALVVRGDGHDRAGAVVHQHVVGDPDPERLAGRRVHGMTAREDAGLLPRRIGALLDGSDGRAIDVVADLVLVRRASRQGLDECVLRRDDEEGRAEQRVRPRREHRDVDVQVVDAEQDLCAL